MHVETLRQVKFGYAFLSLFLLLRWLSVSDIIGLFSVLLDAGQILGRRSNCFGMLNFNFVILSILHRSTIFASLPWVIDQVDTTVFVKLIIGYVDAGRLESVNEMVSKILAQRLPQVALAINDNTRQTTLPWLLQLALYFTMFFEIFRHLDVVDVVFWLGNSH